MSWSAWVRWSAPRVCTGPVVVWAPRQSLSQPVSRSAGAPGRVGAHLPPTCVCHPINVAHLSHLTYLPASPAAPCLSSPFLPHPPHPNLILSSLPFITLYHLISPFQPTTLHPASPSSPCLTLLLSHCVSPCPHRLNFTLYPFACLTLF